MPSCLAYNFLARLFLSSAKTRSRLFYDADYIPSSFTNTTLSQHILSALFPSWSCSFACKSCLLHFCFPQTNSASIFSWCNKFTWDFPDFFLLLFLSPTQPLYLFKLCALTEADFYLFLPILGFPSPVPLSSSISYKAACSSARCRGGKGTSGCTGYNHEMVLFVGRMSPVQILVEVVPLLLEEQHDSGIMFLIWFVGDLQCILMRQELALKSSERSQDLCLKCLTGIVEFKLCGPYNYAVIQWLGLGWTLKTTEFQSPCCG